MGSSNLGQTIHGSDIIFDFELRTTLIATYLSVTHNSERISIVPGLKGTCDFLSVIGKLYCCFCVHKKHQVVTPLEAGKYEETWISVASYIKDSVAEVN